MRQKNWAQKKRRFALERESNKKNRGFRGRPRINTNEMNWHIRVDRRNPRLNSFWFRQNAGLGTTHRIREFVLPVFRHGASEQEPWSGEQKGTK